MSVLLIRLVQTYHSSKEILRFYSNSLETTLGKTMETSFLALKNR